MRKIIIYTDGGARGNPGPAAIGVVLGNQEYRKFLGELTNNQAEYEAIIFSLERARELGSDYLEINLDSELVYKQLIGKYKVKHKNMLTLYQKVSKLLKDFQSVQFNHIPREKNKLADKLVNQALDEALQS